VCRQPAQPSQITNIMAANQDDLVLHYALLCVSSTRPACVGNTRPAVECMQCWTVFAEVVVVVFCPADLDV
jgi:hypothetical protein